VRKLLIGTTLSSSEAFRQNGATRQPIRVLGSGSQKVMSADVALVEPELIRVQEHDEVSQVLGERLDSSIVEESY